MLTNKSWWDTVDFIASNLCGTFFKENSTQSSFYILWNKSNNIWLIRSSILFQLKYKSEIDLKQVNQLIQPHLNSSEFFIQKAIGWILREMSKNNPSYVKNYLINHELKPVSLREVKKYL